MTRQNKHEPYYPYRTFGDMLFDRRQPTPEQRNMDELVVAHNSVADALENFQERYEQLSEQDRQHVNAHLGHIYEILGMGARDYLEEGNNYYTWLEYLLTNMNDVIPRVGRLEKLMEQVLQELSVYNNYVQHSPTPKSHIPQKQQSYAQAPQATDTPDMSDTLSGVSGVSGTPTAQQLFLSQDFRSDVQRYTKPQLMQKYGVSESTIVRVKRMLREQGYNI